MIQRSRPVCSGELGGVVAHQVAVCMCVMVFSCAMAYVSFGPHQFSYHHSHVMLLQNKDPVLHSQKDYSVCWIVCIRIHPRRDCIIDLLSRQLKHLAPTVTK